MDDYFKLAFDGYSSGGADELAFAEVDNPAPCIIDMSDATCIRVASLIYALSILHYRHSQGFHTEIALPKNENTRHFIYKWKFHIAVESIVHRPFYDYQYGHCYQEPENNIYKSRIMNLDDKQVELLSNNFFPIITLKSKNKNFDYFVAEKFAGEWCETYIQSVLKRILKGPSGYFASHIVYEAICNAIKHPNASTIAATSQVYDDNLFVSFWDNGLSIIDTLLEPMKSGIQIFTPPSVEFLCDVDYYKQAKYKGKKIIKQNVEKSSHSIPVSTKHKACLLMSATFPGVTRDIHSPKEANARFDYNIPDESGLPNAFQEEAKANPGMGLFLLTNAAVDIYKGSVIIRTSNYTAEIMKGESPEYRYKYCITEHEDSPLSGNMLTVRLPIKKKND